MAPLSDLNQVLGATRAKLEELTDATALVVADTERRENIEALRKENQRLAAELEQANARRTKLEQAAGLAEGHIAELSKAVDAERREAARLDEQLVKLRQQKEQLEQSLARAEAAREAAVAQTEEVRGETAEKLKLAADQVEELKAELASRRDELEATRQELARATSASERVDARVIALEQVVERSGAETKRLETELAQAKEQLEQAAGAAVATERARQAASSEAQALRDEAKRARQELIAAGNESARLEAANAELEKQMASLHTEWKSATEAARNNLLVMEEKIEELIAALHLARRGDTAPVDGPHAKPEAVDDGGTALRSPPSTQASAPERAGDSDMDQPAASATMPSKIEPVAARAESAPLETANTKLERMLESLRGSRPATRGAHDGASVEKRNAALDPARPEEAAPAQAPEAVGNGRSAATTSLSSKPQPPAPESAGKIDPDQPAGGAATFSMVEPAAAPSEAESGLASFHASVDALNDLEVNAGGVGLFSGVESLAAREVHVSATSAWAALPAVGKQSYLDSLLGAWVAAQGGKGPAVVRIIDPSGQVLVEKSWP